MKRFNQAEYLFKFSGLLILCCGLLFFHSPVDINSHDLYFIIGTTHVTIAVCLLFLIFSLVYFSFKKANKPLYNKLGIAHYILTLLPVLAMVLFEILKPKHNNYESATAEMDHMARFNIILSISIIFFAIGQVLFLTNIIATAIKRNVNS